MSIGSIFHNLTYGLGPVGSGLTLGTGGALLGRYGAAPLIDWLLPELPEKEAKERMERLRNALTIMGAVPGALTTAFWLPWSIREAQKEGNPWYHGLFRPLKKSSQWEEPAVPIGSTQRLIAGDPYMNLPARLQGISFIDQAAGGRSRGLLTTRDLVHGAIGAGLGYVSGTIAGKVLGGLFGLGPKTKKRLRQAGVVAGLLYGTGIVSK